MENKKSMFYRIGQTIGIMACIFIIAMFITCILILFKEVIDPFTQFVHTYSIEFTIGCGISLILFLAGFMFERK